MTEEKKIKGNFPNLRFPEFTGEWEWQKLGDIATISKGSGISKDQLSKTGRPCILYGELYTKYKSEIINEVLSYTDIDTTNLVYSKSNDIIIPSSGETAVDIATARCILFDNILLGGDLNIIRLHKENGVFMSYQLNGVRKYNIAKVAQGVSVIHLYGDSLKKLNVTICSIKEQNKISELLSLLDQRIETQSKIIEKYESLIKGIVDSLFRKKEKNVKLKDCLICHSSTLTESEVLANEGMYPVYGASGIFAHFSQHHVNGDSILIIKDGSNVGKLQYASDKYSVIGTLNYLTAKNNVCLKYIYYYMQSLNFEKYKVGSGIPHIYFKDYRNEPIYCPEFTKQEKFANALSSIDQKILVEKKTLENYSKQKKYLLQSLFI